LTNYGGKRPDLSYRIKESNLPNPIPLWLKLQADGKPYPNIVCEVEVSNESSTTLLNDMNRYFSNMTSTRIWIGVKVWVASKKFWCGWAERNTNGVGGLLHAALGWEPPARSDISVPVNITYNIPMKDVYGPGITWPPNTPPTLDINVDDIRAEILESL
jgi:hypothetical protein